MSLHEEMIQLGDQAVAASRKLAQLSTRKKNDILAAMADELEQNRDVIKTTNAIDLEAGRESGLSSAMIDRLELNDKRIDSMIKGIRDVIELKDPVGRRIGKTIHPNGMQILKIRVPIGVIGIIYESRPNVTVDSSVLCFKASNAVILRGGKEAIHSNRILCDLLQAGGEKKGLPAHAIQLIQTTDRDAVRELVQMEGRVDMAIPRGGEGLIRAVSEQARVPVIKHYKGVCQTYVDQHADLDKAVAICENAKVQRPGVCNAMETLLVHKSIAEEFLPKLATQLATHNVELRGDKTTCKIIHTAKPATEEDWYEEYLDLILAIRVVANTKAAIEHINKYGSKHSDAIVSESKRDQNKFKNEVDSATVYVNASTRFTDGAEFGLGAEIGISTDKLHARGPMGLEELTTYKFVIEGTGQIRS